MVPFQSSFAILFQFSILTSTHKHHKISIQYPSHKCLPEKSGLHCLKMLIMSCFRIQLTVAWLNLTMPNETVKNGIKAKKIKLPQMNIFLEKLINFHVPIGPFHYARFLKNPQSQSRVMRMCHFRTQNGPFVLNKFFLVQTITIAFIYLLALFIVQNF